MGKEDGPPGYAGQPESHEYAARAATGQRPGSDLAARRNVVQLGDVATGPAHDALVCASPLRVRDALTCRDVQGHMSTYDRAALARASQLITEKKCRDPPESQSSRY